MPDINLLQNVNSPKGEDEDSPSSYLNYIGLGIFIIVAAITVILYYGSNKAQAQLDNLNQEQISAKNALVSESGYSRFIKEQSNIKFLKYLFVLICHLTIQLLVNPKQMPNRKPTIHSNIVNF